MIRTWERLVETLKFIHPALDASVPKTNFLTKRLLLHRVRPNWACTFFLCILIPSTKHFRSTVPRRPPLLILAAPVWKADCCICPGYQVSGQLVILNRQCFVEQVSDRWFPNTRAQVVSSWEDPVFHGAFLVPLESERMLYSQLTRFHHESPQTFVKKDTFL